MKNNTVSINQKPDIVGSGDTEMTIHIDLLPF